MLPDIQKTLDKRKVPIRRVGVTGIQLPIRVKRPEGPDLDTVGVFEMACSIPMHVKGTHMSRFTEVLNEHISEAKPFSSDDLQELAVVLADRMQSSEVFIKVTVSYFISQPAPVSNRQGTAPVKCVLEVVYKPDEDGPAGCVVRTGVSVQGKTCCPCSREISDFDVDTGKGKGAHAQRSTITALVAHPWNTMVWFEELIDAAMRSFSSPIYPVLKRVDERAVTMGAYGNPKFVEDVIRDMTVELRGLSKLTWFSIRVQNEESIHYHDAYSEVAEKRMEDDEDGSVWIMV